MSGELGRGQGDLEQGLLTGQPKRGPSSVRSGFSSDDTKRIKDRRGSGTVRELQQQGYGQQASRLPTGKVPSSRQQSSYVLPGAAAPQFGALPTAMRTDGTPLCTKKCGIATAVLAVVGAGLGAGLSYLFREDIQKFWKEKEYFQVLTGAAVGAVVLAGAFLLGRAVWRRLECGGGSKLVKRPAGTGMKSSKSTGGLSLKGLGEGGDYRAHAGQPSRAGLAFGRQPTGLGSDDGRGPVNFAGRGPFQI